MNFLKIVPNGELWYCGVKSSLDSTTTIFVDRRLVKVKKISRKRKSY